MADVKLPLASQFLSHRLLCQYVVITMLKKVWLHSIQPTKCGINGFSKVCSRLLVCHHSALGLSEAKWQFWKPLSFCVNVKRMQKYTRTKPGKQGLGEIVQPKHRRARTPTSLAPIENIVISNIFLIARISPLLRLGLSLRRSSSRASPPVSRPACSLLTSDVISVGGRLKGERGLLFLMNSAVSLHSPT